MARGDKSVSVPTPEELADHDEDKALEAAVLSGDIEPLKDSPAINRLLLKHARKSHAEIAKLTGLSPQEVAERLTALLDNRSWRDDLMEEKLLLAEMGMFMDDVRDRMSRFSVDDESWASMARVQLAAIKTSLEQLDKRRKAVDGRLSVLTMEQAQYFAEAIKLNNQLTAENLALKFGITEEEVYAEWEESFPKAITMLEARADDN